MAGMLSSHKLFKIDIVHMLGRNILDLKQSRPRWGHKCGYFPSLIRSDGAPTERIKTETETLLCSVLLADCKYPEFQMLI